MIRALFSLLPMLSLNEIRDRALHFSKEHAEDSYERGETQKFWIDFFEVFGVDRRRLDFERRVKIEGSQKYIDCFLPGEMLIEHKSKGKDLGMAFQQARDYLRGLKDDELPKHILVSDFERFRLYDLEKGADFYEFKISEFSQKIEVFGFLTGRKKVELVAEDPVNIKASKLMGDLHDTLKDIGYAGHDLEVFLVRILFCLFAEDTGIFHAKQFENYVRNRTAEDGSGLGAKLDELFEVLNTPEDKRLKTLDEELNAFPYINGKLFEENIRKTAFNKDMREQILKCAVFDWSRISPAIFGSLFQYVMDPQKRRDMGAHYTDEQNILKVIRPLFMDQLWDEFEELKNKKRNRHALMEAFHKKLASLKIMDPACGCGNFLVITYRELRKLELEVLKILLEKELKQRTLFSVEDFILLDVNQFYGMEIEEFSAKIAEVSLWLTDHLMNRIIAEEFGQHFARIPLKKSANILWGNALRTDWNEVLPAEQCSYIIGNPPFYGSKYQTQEQREDLEKVFEGVKGAKVLDYVACWYKKAAEYISRRDVACNVSTEVGFVSTNSITQGEQVGILWKDLMENYGVRINMAHQTFKWSNQASGKAQVFVVIIGFALFDEEEKWIFEYEHVKGEPSKKKVTNINGYLVDGPNVFIEKRGRPICEVPEISFGNQPIDGGNLILSEEEKNDLLHVSPNVEKFVKKFIGAREFLHNEPRYCLWLRNASPAEIKQSPFILDRIQKVKDFRLSSSRADTRKLSEVPSSFAFVSHTNSNYIVIPSVSSEKRKYIPVGFLDKDTISSNLNLIIPDASLFHFGVLTSEIHMAWVRYVCGRLKGDYRYSNQIVYNNFPWPDVKTLHATSLRANIETLAQNILDIREKYQKDGASLADLYDPLTMPADLLKAHKTLDKAVEKLYRKEPFESDAERVAFLFERYEEMVKKQ